MTGVVGEIADLVDAEQMGPDVRRVGERSAYAAGRPNPRRFDAPPPYFAERGSEHRRGEPQRHRLDALREADLTGDRLDGSVFFIGPPFVLGDP